MVLVGGHLKPSLPHHAVILPARALRIVNWQERAVFQRSAFGGAAVQAVSECPLRRQAGI